MVESLRADVCRGYSSAAGEPDAPLRSLAWHLGEMVYLWPAADYEGEILESSFTKKRDKSAALRFMKKAVKRHGEAEAIVTDGSGRTPRRCVNWAIWSGARRADTSTIGPRVRICHSDDESGRCSDFDRRSRYKNSPQSAPL